MTPLVKQILDSFKTSDYIPPARRIEIAIEVEKVYHKVAPILQQLTFEGYSIAEGHQLSLRARAKGPSMKFVVGAQWDNTAQKNILQSGIVVHHAVRSKISKALELVYGRPAGDLVALENYYKSQGISFITEILCKESGPEIQKKLDALKPNTASVQKAQDQIIANRKRGMEASKRHALEKLSGLMSSYNYSFTQQEVLEAWRMSEVKKVMES